MRGLTPWPMLLSGVLRILPLALVATLTWPNLVAAPAIPALAATAPRFGVIQNDGNHLADEWARGIRVKFFEVGWDHFEQHPGVIDQWYVNQKKAELRALQAQGFAVMLEPDLHFPPQWVFNLNANTRFRDQYGDVYAQPESSGTQIVDGVWNPAVRQAMAWYLTNLFKVFGTSFYAVRTGAGYYGELHYPPNYYNNHSNCFWAFDGAAQAQSPVPGWQPGQSSANHQSARAFVTWYLNSLTNFQNFLITTMRASYPGEIFMLYPGWGVRTGQVTTAINSDLNGSSVGSNNIADGVDWQTQIAALPDANVGIYCTWIDSDPTWSNDNDPHATLQNNNWSPIKLLSVLGSITKRPVWAENSGFNNFTTMQLAFLRIKTLNLACLMWVNEAELYSGQFATITQYQLLIKQAGGV